MSPKLTPDTSFKEAITIVAGEDPEALNTLVSLKEVYPEETWIRLISFLYEQGPRGEKLGYNFQLCDKNPEVLGKDLIARIQELDETVWKVSHLDGPS